MDVKSEKKHCLGHEILSAAIDGECALSEENLQHIAACEPCHQRYEELKKLDSILQAHWRVPMDNFSADTLRFNVHRKLAERRKISTLRLLRPAGVAAGIMIIVGATLFFGELFKPPAPQAPLMLAEDSLETDSSFPYYPTKSSIINNRTQLSSKSGNSQYGALPLNFLIPVDSAKNNSVLLYLNDLMANGAQSIAQIDKNVTHIWTFNDGNKAAKSLERLIEALKLNNKCQWFFNEKGNIVASSDMTKGELIQFVKQAKSYGWELLSAQSPQPENTILLSGENEPVHYSMTIVLTK